MNDAIISPQPTAHSPHAVLVSEFWNSKNASPFATVITAHYNRPNTIKRAMDSVEHQTFRDIEYIIIDDGSTNSSDEIIKTFMNETELPVMFIKQENNRGVHTARNLGVKYARGKFLINLDSDDELLPRACEIFHDAWDSIPDERKNQYAAIAHYICDVNGNLIGTNFPENINLSSLEEIKKFGTKIIWDQTNCWSIEIYRANSLPEPHNIHFVSEVIQKIPLHQKYLLWFVPKTLRIYHTEGNEHLCNPFVTSVQGLKDELWDIMYKVNHSDIFLPEMIRYLKYVLRYNMTVRIMRKFDPKYDPAFVKKYKLEGFKNKFWQCILFFPAMLLTNTYKKKRCKF